MFAKKSMAALVLAGALLSLPAFSQDYKSDATVQGTGNFVKGTTDSGVRQSATDSGGVLATYRYYFTKHHGAEVNYGYSLNTQKYALSSGTVGVHSHSHEVSAAYVFRYPLKRWTPFALAGVGAIVFDPKDESQSRSLGASTQARAAFVYGGGADFSITKRIFFRAQYRGLVYNSPTFDAPGVGPDRVTHRAEPSAGVGFRF